MTKIVVYKIHTKNVFATSKWRAIWNYHCLSFPVCLSFRQFVCSFSEDVLPKQTAVSMILDKLSIIFKKNHINIFEIGEICVKLGIFQISYINPNLTNPMAYKILAHVLWRKVLVPAIKLQDSLKSNISKMC